MVVITEYQYITLRNRAERGGNGWIRVRPDRQELRNGYVTIAANCDKLMRGYVDAISKRQARRNSSTGAGCWAAGLCLRRMGARLQPGPAAGSRRQRPQLRRRAEGALRGPGITRWISLGLRQAGWRDAPAGAGTKGRVGAGRHAAQLSLADVSESLHHRDRPVSGASRDCGQQFL